MPFAANCSRAEPHASRVVQEVTRWPRQSMDEPEAMQLDVVDNEKSVVEVGHQREIRGG